MTADIPLSTVREDRLMIRRWVDRHLELDDASVGQAGRLAQAARHVAQVLSSLDPVPVAATASWTGC
jgi:hypothetical protein